METYHVGTAEGAAQKSVVRILRCTPSHIPHGHDGLDGFPLFVGYNGRMMIRLEILGNECVPVIHLDMLNGIQDIGFLHQQMSSVFFIAHHHRDGMSRPFPFAA